MGEKHHSKHPGAKLKKHPSELPESFDDKILSVQQGSPAETLFSNLDTVLDLKGSERSQEELIPKHSEYPSSLINQQPPIHDRYVVTK